MTETPDPRQIIIKAAAQSFSDHGFWSEHRLADTVLAALEAAGITLCTEESAIPGASLFRDGEPLVRYVPLSATGEAQT